MREQTTVRFNVALASALLAACAQAANYYWDGDTVTVDGVSGGGSGAWTVGAAGWEDGATALNWANGNTAVLGGSGTFTNTLGGAITAAGMTVSGASYVISGAQSLTAGALDIASGASLELANGTSTLNFSGLAGAGALTVNKGASSSNITGLNTADALAFGGTLKLRGGNATTSPSSVSGHWLKLADGAAFTQAAGTAFALDTGASATDAKDLILDIVTWGGKALTLSSLTGYGAIRSDWGTATTYKTIVVTQSVNTTFNGMVLSHGTSSASRKIAFKKAGVGQLTLTGIVGLQTAGAGGTFTNHVVDIDVLGGTLVMTANNTTYGSVAVRDGAVLKMQNASAGTGFTGGNSSMTGNYTVDAGGTLQGFRNGTAAFGQGAILLNGGTLAQEQGNWTWANGIVLNTGTASTLENQSSYTGTRALKIQGVVSGDGDLTFSDTTGGMGVDTGFIFTGSNTLSGTVTIPANRKVRVGGVPGSSSDLSAGIGGTLGTAAIVNNGTLTFSRSDAHEVANAISGSGNVRVGSSGIAGSTNQILTLSGANTYTGGTGVNTGTLLVNGTHTGGSLYDIGAAATLGGTGTVSVAGGGHINLLAGSTLAPGPASGEGGTFTLNTLTLSATASLAIDATNDLAVVTGDLTLNGNAVMLANESSFDRKTLHPILTCSGTVSGSLTNAISGSRWQTLRIDNTFYLQYHPFGTLIRVL